MSLWHTNASLTPCHQGYDSFPSITGSLPKGLYPKVSLKGLPKGSLREAVCSCYIPLPQPIVCVIIVM